MKLPNAQLAIVSERKATHYLLNPVEREIDQQDYALYGLTPEETGPRIGGRVQIVDDATK